MIGLVKFVAVAIFVGCSFCWVCAGNPYDMSGHFWPSRDTAKGASDSIRFIRYTPAYPPPPSPYEVFCALHTHDTYCTLLIGCNNSFLPLGASFGAIAASVLMKNLDSTDRYMFPIWLCSTGCSAPAYFSLYTRKLLGKIEMDSIPAIDELPVIDEKYFVYNAPENEFRDEKSERPKTIPAGFHNPSLAIVSEDRMNFNETMSNVGKGLCYGSIAAAILTGGTIPVVCEKHGTH